MPVLHHLLTEMKVHLMYQIKSLTFLIMIIFTLKALIFHSFSMSQVAQKPESTQEERIASLLHAQIYENKLDEFIETLDTYPQYIDIAYPKQGDYITPLQLAAILGKRRFINELLQRGANPSLQTPNKGHTIFHLVRITHIIQRFIDLDLGILEVPNNQSMTPLLSHIYKANPPRATIHALLEAGANPNTQTKDSRLAPLHILFKPHHSQSDQEDLMLILEDLLDHGAHLTIRNREGATPLNVAARNNSVQGIRSLMKKAKQIGMTSYINIRDFKYKNTPLADAYFYESREAIIELLKLRANPLITSNGISVNGKAHQDSKQGSRFAQFVLDAIDKYFRPNTCAPPLTNRNENPSYVSN